MQTATTTFVNRLKTSHLATSKPEVTIEWNCNRFGTLQKLTNGGEEIDDDTHFPLSSIIDARRPEKSGLIKGVVQPGSLGREAYAYKETGIPTSRRVYTASPDAKYKYWLSPNESSSVLSSGGYSISGVSPAVVYEYGLTVNKLVAQFENSGANPMDVVVQYTTNGTTWITAGTATPNASGRIEFYLQDNNTWSQTENLNNSMSIRGIRVQVPRMSKPRVHCHVIEIALMHKLNVSSRTIDFSTEYGASEASFVAPLGRAETATGTLNLSNVDGYFDNDRTGAFLYGRMNSPAKVIIKNAVTVGGATNNARMCTMFVETWGDQSDENRQLSLSDASYFLKTENPPPFLLRRATGTEIIWRLLDSIGFTDFKVDESPDGDTLIPYFWTDSEKSVWEHIQEISEGLQIACYFDEFGTLRIRPRETVYEAEKYTLDWVFDGAKVTSAMATEQSRTGDVGKLPDLISIDKPYDLHANKVTVEYQDTRISALNKHQPKMEQVWEPEGTVALRTASLSKSISKNATSAVFTDSNFATWPYTGVLQMDGEIIRWTRKRYSYVDASGATQMKWIDSDAAKAELDGLNPGLNHKNKFDGGLYFGDENRGIWNSVPRDHSILHKFNLVRYRHGNTSPKASSKYTSTDYKNSVFNIKTPKSFKKNSWLVARRGAESDLPPRYIGTSLKFSNSSAYNQGSAGVFIGGSTLDSGYYIELSLTSYVGKRRKYVNEVSIYVRKTDGTLSRIGAGKAVGIAKGTWYDLDVYQRDTGNGLQITIVVNGVEVMTRTVPSSQVLSGPMGGIYGVFARGNTHVSFEYLYAATSTEDVPSTGDDSTRWDLIEGGFRSNYYNRYLYRTKGHERLTRRSSNQRVRNAGFSFDEFGVKAHELREFDVTFSKTPVIHSRLYLSNEWYADCVEYVADHDGARFVIVGKGRDNVILNGEDNLLYGADNPVDQKLFVYGRVVEVKDTQKYEVENTKSIKRTGPVELTISSPWIQSESTAKKIGNWIAKHWGDGSEVVEIETFGNTLLQVGDVVGISHPRKSMTPQDHIYYITRVSQSYAEGLTTKYTLQRKIKLIS